MWNWRHEEMLRHHVVIFIIQRLVVEHLRNVPVEDAINWVRETVVIGDAAQRWVTRWVTLTFWVKLVIKVIIIWVVWCACFLWWCRWCFDVVSVQQDLGKCGIKITQQLRARCVKATSAIRFLLVTKFTTKQLNIQLSRFVHFCNDVVVIIKALSCH